MLEEIELTENTDLVKNHKPNKDNPTDMIVVTENGSVAESLDEENWEHNLLLDDKNSESDNAALDTDALIKLTDSQAADVAVVPSTCRSKFIYLVDVFFSVFVASPISGFFWYTIWKFTEEYLYIYSQNFTYFLVYFIGFIVLAFAFLLQDAFQKTYDYLNRLQFCSQILCFFMRNIYIYIITVAVTIEWQGLWDLIESNIDDLQTKLSLSVIAITYACLTRATRSLVSTPFLLTIDDDDAFFQYELKSHSIFEGSILANFVLSEIIDCLVMVVGWVGFDNSYDYIFDQYLSPTISIKSLAYTFSISHVTYFIVVLLQYPVYQYMLNKSFIMRLIVEHVMNIIMFISSILLWKFYWDIGDYILDDLETHIKIGIFLIGNLLTFMVGVALKITWILPGPGVITFDGDHEDRDAYFIIDYFQTYFKEPTGQRFII